MEPTDLLTTNPVLALDHLLSARGESRLAWATQPGVLDQVVEDLSKDGIVLPAAAMMRWRSEQSLSSNVTTGTAPRPGVVGLVHDRFHGVGYVVPLVATVESEWRLGNSLPGNVDDLLDLLNRLLSLESSTSGAAFPEARGVTLSTPFPTKSDGNSMDLALILAALDALRTTPHPSLRAACAVATVEGDRIVSIGGVREKLSAFVREVGRGSLLVRPQTDEAAASYDENFEDVWPVADLAELAERLLHAGLLDPFRCATPLDRSAASRLLTKLHLLAEERHDHRAVIALARRLLGAVWVHDVPSRTRAQARQFLPAALRHLGEHEAALVESRTWVSEVSIAGDIVSLEEMAKADLELASSLFDPWRMAEALDVLSPWLHRLTVEPRALGADLRARIWNTAARSLVALGKAGWRELFEKTLQLQGQTEPRDTTRTRNYLVHALLRTGQLDDAERQLGGQDARTSEHGSDPWVGFLRADLARRRQAKWSDPSLDGATPREGAANHPLGIYLQATARQPWPSHERARRFRAAADCFLFDASRNQENNVLWILVRTMELGEALARNDQNHWQRAVPALVAAMDHPGFEAFRTAVSDVLPDVRSRNLEPFLERLPWL